MNWTAIRNWFRPTLRRCTCGGVIHWHSADGMGAAICDRCGFMANSGVRYWTDEQVNEARASPWACVSKAGR